MRPSATVMAASVPRRGITLLEVLIACGLLVVGLSTIAAILPAAGSRLAQASVEDRAGVLASNALAEMKCRGLVAADAFPAAAPAGTLAIGAVVGLLPALGDLPAGRVSGDYFAGPSAEGVKRCGSPRTFALEDELIYDPPALTDTPANAFTLESGTLGPRQVREGVCWGATLTPQKMPPHAGGLAALTIAIFKKGGESRPPVPVILTRTNSFYEADVASSGSLLRACTWLLAIPSDPIVPPRWFQVMSSWTLEPPANQTTRLIFRNQEAFEDVTATRTSGSAGTVLAFEGLVRVDEHVVTLF